VKVAISPEDKVDAVFGDEVEDGLEDRVEDGLKDRVEDGLEDRVEDGCEGVASFTVEVVREDSVVNVVPFVS
jgi:hypothetical protein